MTPEQIQQLIDQLLQTGELLATKAFEISMRQVLMQAYLNTFWGVVCLIVTTILVAYAVKFYKLWEIEHTERSTKYHQDIWINQCRLCIVIGVLTIVPTIVLLNTAFSYFMNPQWYAVRFLLEGFGF